MQSARLGKSNMLVGKVALGTMNFGVRTAEADAFRIMDRAMELGINLFDTANIYGQASANPDGQGITEEVMGRWFAQGGSRRESVVLATKVAGSMHDATYGPNDVRGYSGFKIRRQLDDSLRDIEITEVGMGCMAFSHGYGAIPGERCGIEAIRGAYDAGCMFFDTAEAYGPSLDPANRGHSERVVGKALGDVRDKVVIATKLFLDAGEVSASGVYGAMRGRLDASLERLGTDHVELYYLHRLNKDVAVEDVAEAMGRLIDEGLIGGWGLSAVGVDARSRAQAVTPLSAVQNIYSMVERDAEYEVIPYCAEHRIGLVAFSPVASGLLSGKVTPKTQFEKVDDVRNWVPQLSKENLAASQPLVELLQESAAKKGCTPAQLSLAWMLLKYPVVVPIPGSKNKGRILENLAAANVELTDEEFGELQSALDSVEVFGHRGIN